MKASLNWIKEFVEVEVEYSSVVAALEQLGFEVEKVTSTGDDVRGVVVGEVLEVKQHPNADRLSLCTVSDGKEKLSVVCGASNVDVGQRVALARIGGTIAGGADIKKIKIRGVESSGMICSAGELGCGGNGSGILVLDKSASLGQEVNSVLGLNDIILDVNITPNRPDCLNHLGLAKELAAYFGCVLRLPQAEITAANKEAYHVSLENPNHCGRYVCRILKEITITNSPFWMARRLHVCGFRPINNVVDVTNYVMLEMGHPLHAFDLEKLTGGSLAVRLAKEGESLEALDNRIYSFSNNGEELVIADKNRPVAIAGIIGGTQSAVSDETKAVLLESAYFDPMLVRKTSKKLGISTESSYRFERGADIEMADHASRRAATLISKIAGGKLTCYIDSYPATKTRKMVTLDPINASKILGMNVNRDTAAQILVKLGFEIEPRGSTFRCWVPSGRKDIEIEHDLVEEIARLIGYDKIPARLSSYRPGALSRGAMTISNFSISGKLRELLVGFGFYEAYNTSFLSKNTLQEFGGETLCRVAPGIINPLSSEWELLRPSLVPGLVSAVARNVERGQAEVRLFELGKAFRVGEKEAGGWFSLPEPRRNLSGFSPEGSPSSTGILNQPPASFSPQTYGNIKERYMLGMAVCGSVDFFDLKSWVTELCHFMHAEVQIKPSETDVPYLHPGQTGAVIACRKNELAGFMGQISPRLYEFLRLEKRTTPIFCAELDWETLVSNSVEKIQYEPPSKFPAITRDICLNVPENVNWDEIEKCVYESGSMLVEKVSLFDVYNKNVAGFRSLTFKVSFRHRDRTLTDEEINGIQEKMISALKNKLGAELRA